MTPGARGGPPSYVTELGAIVAGALRQLVRQPSHSRRAVAARYWARRMLLLTALLAVVIAVLMVALDATEIGWMPPRGTAALWPVRIITDFGKSAYVLWTLALLLLALVLIAAKLGAWRRVVLLSLATRVQFLFLAVLVPVLIGDVLKGVIGRGRPFVGGEANAFNFSHFAWSEAYASLPSGHATTAFALAFAVSALWPRTMAWMFGYAILIAVSRLVLLAHHPSDVVAGALTGIIGAMAVRYWFAARRLAFTIQPDGRIVALPGPSLDQLKKVARGAFPS
ncbi:undecaprenyl-diphosphatase [Rhodopseudomonas faecalis]|uniref:Undecaprenyl-diphosphatase n=1 Tax=Rhodopseudomonas faecalis TaxID=99655 RepID=A0A318TNX4_9BRAD|nr:phosphatase PAP2 family protein [Rhodopseudomonas faecalis]PYF05570.1 undecaprenyl-diphosphatase [Rhodopseudomonas faecalis]TAH67665.1 MAG: phosphatase PAP2 family protein [Rhodopseudomonas palustris]